MMIGNKNLLPCLEVHHQETSCRLYDSLACVVPNCIGRAVLDILLFFDEQLKQTAEHNSSLNDKRIKKTGPNGQLFTLFIKIIQGALENDSINYGQSVSRGNARC